MTSDLDKIVFRELIIDFLLLNPGTPAKIIAKKLDTDKTSINSLLYKDDLFISVGEKPPLWSVKTQSTGIDKNIQITGKSTSQNIILGDETNKVSDLATDESLKSEIESFIQNYPGVEYGEIALNFDCSIEQATAHSKKFSWLVLDSSDEDEQDESLDEKKLEHLETLRTAATMAYPLSTNAYDELINKGFIKGVSAIRIQQIFGTWRTACSLAGVEAPPPVHEHYDQKYTENELIDAVARFVLEIKFRGSMHNYDAWRESLGEKSDEPSSGTLRNYLGPSWRKVRNRGLMAIREKWINAQDNFLSSDGEVV